MDDSGSFLYTGVVSCCAGIVLALLFHIAFFVLAVLLSAALLLACTGVIARQKKSILVSIALCACVLGVVRTNFFLANEAQENVKYFVGQSAVIVGTITNDPERRDTSLHVNIAVQKIVEANHTAPVSGMLLAILPRETSVAYGDTVAVSGSIVAPQPFTTDTGHVFDYPGYLRVQGVSAEITRAQLQQRVPGPMSLQKFLFDIKHLFEHSLEQLFPEPDNSLLQGILLGERRGIPKDLTNAFVASGLVHVVVLSGHNITIVSEGVFRALAFLPRTTSFAVGGVMMVLFALMTGAGATTVRALTMALVALLARYLHRSALALRSLAVAGVAMALWDPLELLYDPSFILSMLATFGLITFAPWVEQKIRFIPNFKKFDIRSIAATTIAVELFVAPALLYFSGVLSFFSLPANILALPVIPLAMLLGFVAGVAGLVSPALGFVPAMLCDLLLKWMLFVVTTVVSLPFATATVGAFSAWILCAVYIPLTAFAMYVYRKGTKNESKQV